MRPASEFVAHFVGDNNTLEGTVLAIDDSTGETRTATVKTSGATLTAFAPPDVGVGDRVLALVRPENIEILPNGAGGEASDVLSGMVDQIVFEGPTVRLVVDVDGTPIKVTSSGLERLSLLNREAMRLNLRLQDVTLVKPTPQP